MTTTKTYDAIVIGGGPGGYVAPSDSGSSSRRRW